MNTPNLKSVKKETHPLVTAAIFEYHCRGVIPVRPASKFPYIKEWQKRGMATYPELTEWPEQWPDLLLGVVTGQASRTFMVDIDNRDNGDKTLAVLEGKYGPLPKTCCFKTPGGIRYVFKWVPGVYIRTTAKQIGPGLDVRGHREDGQGTGQSIVPPSVRPDGGAWPMQPLQLKKNVHMLAFLLSRI